MVIAYKNKPKRFTYQVCHWQAELKDLDSVTCQFKKGEFVIVKSKLGYSVFTEGEVRINPDDQNAKNWAIRKLREAK